MTKNKEQKKIRTIYLFEEVCSEQSSILAYKPFSLILIEKLKIFNFEEEVN
jgi:hypothetical protein